MAFSNAVVMQRREAGLAARTDWRSALALALLPIGGLATIAWIGFWLWMIGEAVLTLL